MEWWIAYPAIGVVAGFFAGLLGIGGGSIIVPLLVGVYEGQGLPRDQILHLAVGTGMGTILITSVSSVRAHAMRGAIRWDIAKAMTPGILLGGLIGSSLTRLIPARAFVVFFAIVIYVAAIQVLIEFKPAVSRGLPGPIGMFAAGFGISVVAALTAVGGAFMSIPFMLWCGVPLLPAIGIAAMIGFPIAFAGSIGYVLAGLGQSGLPAWSLGYIYVPGLLGVTVASVLTAPLGAAAAHRMPTRRLRQVFCVVMMVLATRVLWKVWH
jgi:uncharacterized membrane protein YfcA